MAIAPGSMTKRGSTMQSRNIGLAVVVVAFCLSPSLLAASYTWDFTGNAGTNCGSNASCSAAGNSIVFSSGGVTVKATAWYVGQSGGFQAATLGQYANGLGVCYPGENCTSLANQQVSDQLSGGFSFDEFILFEFSKPVDPSSINLQSATSTDKDVSYWLGGNSQSLNLAGRNAADNTVTSLSSLGFGSRNDSSGNQGTTRVVDLTGGTPAGSVDAILFGASYAYNSRYNDSFLIGGMSGTLVNNPEPSSIILLFTLTLFAFGTIRRARRKPAQTTD